MQHPGDDIFQPLDALERAEVERQITYIAYPAGQVFYSPNDPGDRLYLLRTGRVRIYKLSPEGRALTLVLLEPVTVFGDMSLSGPWFHDSFAESMADSIVGAIGRDTLRGVMERHPRVALAYMEVMGRRLRAMENRLADIAFKSVPSRLATVLLSLAGAEAVRAQGGPPPSAVRYTHQQLADMIGSYRETVTKALGELREAGLIRIEDEALIICDTEALQRIANR